MANVRKTQVKKISSPNIIQITATPIPTPEIICNEPQASILHKLGNGEYTIVKRNICSSVWKIFREIRRPDGTKLLGRYYCVGCNQILKSIGDITSNLRSHKCHADFLKKQTTNPLNSTTISTNGSSSNITANNTVTGKRKRGLDMSDTEWEPNSDDGKKNTSPVSVRYQKNDKKKKKPILKQTKEVPKETPRCDYKRFNWTEDATRVFLQLWAAHIDDLRGSRMKKEVHKEMANEMQKFEITYTEVKAKIDNMSKRYKQESEMSSSTGIPSQWEYFYKLRSLLTGTASTVKSFEEIIVKQQVSDSDNESNHAASFDMEHDENLMKEDEDEEEFDNSMMLQDDQQTNLSTRRQHKDEPEDDDDFEEQQDLDTSASPSNVSPKVNRAERLLQIEKEKLQIEREKLSVMRTFKQDLASFHKDLMEILRRKFNK
ncbi:trihelix transcription factor ASIL1 [Drosophila willistoni]|uniref:trihelix transcription factor ASIL1 n=1 Tax=Drosophila willistoni TaxID=7260 RepID=UPI000C26DA17|nr:trihelix transcription factor ASIL1 [Drosophila willistoni]